MNDYLPTNEAAEALGLTPTYFRFIANQRGWQSQQLGKDKLKWWPKADVASFLAESLKIRNVTYTVRTLQQLTGLSDKRLYKIAKDNNFLQPMTGRWFKADWNPILEKRGINLSESGDLS
jgi:predicted DNA-binding transcriptional regulator AlpA